MFVFAFRVKFREQELQKKLEEKEKKKEELRHAEEEKEHILEAIRQKVQSVLLTNFLHVLAVASAFCIREVLMLLSTSFCVCVILQKLFN